MAQKENGFIVGDRAAGYAQYPHARRAGDLLFISGVSSRRPDNSHVGVTIHPDGHVERDIRAQTRAVIENIAAICAAGGASLDHVVDMTVFLVDLNDYKGMNEVYNEFFQPETGPTRTTVVVRSLPHPHLLVEMKAIASFSA
jgi:2-aminomuconate deaminase